MGINGLCTPTLTSGKSKYFIEDFHGTSSSHKEWIASGRQG